MRLRLLCLTLLLGFIGSARAQQTPAQGRLEHATLPPGHLYPGSPHTYAVYIPAEYDGKTPLPYTVWMDGSFFLNPPVNITAKLDQLIAEHAIPPMIGIFVEPGILPATDPATQQNRYERSFEYDSLSPRFSHFLTDELIPAVAAKYKLSTSPDDHALAGISTGAVAAFMAAWNRPDQFHRVLSFIGTYVAMRGGETISTLVRKSEPRPLRIWLEDGDADHITPAEPYGTFYAGSWPTANRVLYDALQFGGYDAKLTIGPGGHDMKLGAELLPDALRWLWRDPAQPLTPHPPAALNAKGWDTRGSIWSTVTAPNDWQRIAVNDFPVHGLAVTANGDLVLGGRHGVRRLTFAGSTTELTRAPATGVTVDREDHVYATLPTHEAAAEARTTQLNLLAASGLPKSMEGTRNMAALAAGPGRHLYFADRTTSVNGTRIGTLDLDAKSAAPKFTSAVLHDPSGFALSPDAAMLVVTDAGDRSSWSFQLDKSGTPQNGEPFYRLETQDRTPEGALAATFDSLGQVYFATALGVQICEANGRVAMILNRPDPGNDSPIDSLAFAGPNRDWLYVTQAGKLYRRHLQTHGVPLNTPQKPPQPPL